jgi:hypothetical protein
VFRVDLHLYEAFTHTRREGNDGHSWKQILLLMLHRRRIRTISTFVPSKSWWVTTRERSTTTTAMPPRLDTWIGLSSQIRSAGTTSVAGSPSYPRRGASASVLAALRSRQLGASSAFGRLHRTLLALCVLADSLEKFRGNHVVSACQSVEREPPPDGGIRALAGFGRYPQPSRCIPLCI